ncbi:tail fiber protein [Phaeobacter sp. QD34_3]|uniref:phage tail protein n=1 Tax=unclassified Phaeobacter TaxID=2621772 RepID=UPI00237FBD4C|nr:MULTISPECIES: tail fiber protein [unclassified Phaeobacter]MDE4135066.1 tail fiber protein [Phaeobacter sp. QD34_3]MDE4138696.1 tail fiber protein [Phaeobacter sp. QD34_24]MDE4176453.1 tail fiber protein [Phaeobacter sp. PT47_59]
MAEPFLAEIRIVGFNFAPRGWAFCDGQFLPINQNQSLYSLLGTTYGGDGRTSFALPDLRGRTPLHVGNGHSLGTRSGAETMTLTTAQIPSHDHVAKASSLPGNAREPSGALLAAEVAPDAAYATVGAGTSRTLRAGTVTNVGGGQAHDNMQPFMAINFCIALQGLFPSRS